MMVKDANSSSPLNMNKENNQSPVICWLRRDLRLEDHTALYYALQTGRPVQLIFVFDEKILAPLRKHASQDKRLTFIIQALTEIEHKLKKAGASLKILHGDPTNLVPAYAQEIGASAVYLCRDYEPYACERDQAVKKRLESDGIKYHDYKDHVMMEASQVLKDDGSIYKVFTPYKRKWLETFLAQGKELSEFKCSLKNLRAFTQSENTIEFDWHQALGFTPDAPILTGTRSEALKRLDYFRKHILATYHETRDFPDIDGTSMLSPYIRHGLLSVRELVATITSLSVAGEECWLSELIWREFYQMLLSSTPSLASKAFRPNYDTIKWRGGEREFNAWCAGQTGFPIVDAAMRCLNQTGLMPNRLRMVTASFLCKTLLVDWRWGEQYFARKLLDFDLAANNGGWQWCSSSGADAQPYFRIFNPYAQSEKFDQEGEFIKRWCPELALVGGKAIHRPDQMNPLEEEMAGCHLGREYPLPIVDYAKKRQEALEMYKAVQG